MVAILKRETRAYYTGMIGYVTAAVSLFFLGLWRPRILQWCCMPPR